MNQPPTKHLQDMVGRADLTLAVRPAFRTQWSHAGRHRDALASSVMHDPQTAFQWGAVAQIADAHASDQGFSGVCS